MANASCLAIGVGLGWLTDHLADTFPLFVFVGLALGIGAACAYTFSEGRKFLEE